MLFSEWYKIMVNKVIFVGFKGVIAPISPLDPALHQTKYCCSLKVKTFGPSQIVRMAMLLIEIDAL